VHFVETKILNLNTKANNIR